jgi:hypothetical protein
MARVDQSVHVRKGARSVPPGHVLTPGGYRHESLTHFVPEGHRVRRRKGQLQLVHRRTQRIVSRYPSVPDDEPIPDIGTGWVTYAWWFNNSGSPISQLSTQWIVPQPPTTQSNQTIFLFNALEDAQNNDLLQAVLQWGISHAGGGPYWAIGNWYIDTTGHACFSKLVQVQPGEVLTGVISMAQQNNDAFSYVSSFLGYSDLDMRVDSVSELVWASETLEAYQIGDCNEYPNSPTTSMCSISLAAGGAAPPVMWLIKNVSTDCGESSTVVDAGNPGGQIDIRYRS